VSVGLKRDMWPSTVLETGLCTRSQYDKVKLSTTKLTLAVNNTTV